MDRFMREEAIVTENSLVNETDDQREKIKMKLRQYYDGRIVRKDLTKQIREGANVPVYVLEYLLGRYCNSDDEEIINERIENVKRILRDNYVRPDEAQKILALLRERGRYTIIDRITVVLNTKEDRYEATFMNLGIRNIPNQSGRALSKVIESWVNKMFERAAIELTQNPGGRIKQGTP